MSAKKEKLNTLFKTQKDQNSLNDIDEKENEKNFKLIKQNMSKINTGLNQNIMLEQDILHGIIQD